MTSLEWQPENIYGDHVAPVYSAVSYTWGRYDLDIPGAKRQKKFRNVKGIKILGIDWPVPRINPVEQFSVDQFSKLIKKTCEPVNDGDLTLEFLWLDVSCIDQNNGPQKMAEIGRQAVIFEGAHRVFIWLTKLCEDTLTNTMDILVRSCEAKKESGRSRGDLMDWTGAARASLDDLFIDPWFTSLWTLQEAFLCPRAYLVPLEASLIRLTPNQKGDRLPVTLATLCSISAALAEIVAAERASVSKSWQADMTNASLLRQERFLDDVNGMLIQRGVTALASRSPIALYNAAQYRRTRDDKDRVYGIQQVFGFRLGASAPGCNELDPKAFNRHNLEDQLGAALVENYPVASQLHNFTEPADEGTGWRISSSSIVPRLEIKTSFWSLQFHASCKITTDKVKGQRHGLFDGQICDLAPLAESWRETHSDPHIKALLGGRSPQQMILDTVFEDKSKARYNLKNKIRSTDDGPEGLVWGSNSNDRVVPRGERQHRLVSALIRLIGEHFDGAPLVVLLLGSFADVAKDETLDAPPHDKYHVGLILTHLTREAVTTWTRLGICIWQYEYNGVIPKVDACQRPDLHGHGTPMTCWRHLSDSFG
ncbi:MAG: hypothetical protein Q9200_001563 [Gallowayella weberi]